MAAVERLWHELEAFGFEVQIDLAHPEPRPDWQEWMEQEIEDADWVLVVASPEYLTASKGSGAPE